MQSDKSSGSSNKVMEQIKAFFHIRGMGQVISVTCALIAMCIAFGMQNKNFFSTENNLNLLRQVAPILLIGIGQSYVLITGCIDLSIGSVIGMASMISAILMTKTEIHPVIVCIVTLFCAALIGLTNGLLVAKAKLPPFIATLGTMIIARGIAQMNDRHTDAIKGPHVEAFKNFFYYGKGLFGIFMPVWIAIVLFIIFAFILAKTRTGRYVYAIGSNYDAAKLSGVNVVYAQTIAYIFSAVLAAVVGIIFTAKSSMGAMDAGTGYELNAVAASVIGGVSTMGGQGMLFGTVIGSFIWGVLQNGLQFAGAKLAYKNLVIGVVVIISVLIDRIARGNKTGLINGIKAIFKPKNT